MMHKSKKVLIESDWNLKWVECYGYLFEQVVLIESDWNLKLVHKFTIRGFEPY